MDDRAQVLHESEALLKSIVDTAVDGIITIDEEGIVQSFNPAAERIFGFAAHEVIGAKCNQLMPAPYREQHDSYLANYLRTGIKKIIGIDREVVGRRKDGTTFPMELVVREVHLSDRRLFAAFVRDLSWRKQMETLRADFVRHVMSAQEEERRRMALDLHDGIGQGLTSLLVGLQALRVLPSLEAVRERTNELHRHTALALDEVRRLARGMRPLVLDELGLAAALEHDVAEFSRTHGVAVDLHAPGLPRLPSEVETTVYRIVQESLTNVAKHAAAKTVSIVVHWKGAFLEAIIEDDGCGFDSDEVLHSHELGKHLGLSSLSERAAFLNGSVTIESVPGSGTTIRVRIPLPEEPE
jgi:PAS domain S-box-containing protein